MNIIDACGLSCPQPVIMLKKAIDSGSTNCQILVDNQTAVENISRFSENAGFKASSQKQGEDFLITVEK